MGEEATYVAITGPSQFELRQTALPDVPPDGALLRIESCGVCGTDVELFRHHAASVPIAPGHEVVGRIERVGRDAADRWGVAEGSRMAVRSRLACGQCQYCRRHEYCREFVGPLGIAGYGYLAASQSPPLSGGFATHLYLHPCSQFVPVPEQMPVAVASLYNALSNGIGWVVATGGVRPGERVAILGPGPRGLACAVAARAAGASDILLTGLASDRRRLDFARRLARADTVEVGDGEAGSSLPNQGEFDLVIDTTPGSIAAMHLAMELVKTRGRVILAGLKHGGVLDLDVDNLIRRQVTVKGALSSDLRDISSAMDLLGDSQFPFAEWASDCFSLDVFDQAIDAAAGDTADERALHVRVEPLHST